VIVVTAGPADEALLLDLLNSTPVVDGVPRDDLADRPAARAWMRARDITATDVEWGGLIEARNILQAVVRGERSPADLAPLVAGVAYQPKATKAGLLWEPQVQDAAESAVRAVLAWDKLRVSSPGRLRPCANTDCQQFLIDRSKPNTARWCSMAICGNRMKARRHYNRARSAADAPA
jgi:predicted RNA-binding Zn ribbon-like protein